MRIVWPTRHGIGPLGLAWLESLARQVPVSVRLLAVGEEINLPPAPPSSPALSFDRRKRQGYRGTCVNAEAREFGADLIMFPTRGFRGVAARARRSLATEIVLSASLPVVLLGPRCRPPATDLRTLVVPLDGSAYAVRSVHALSSFAREFDTGALFLHVHESESPDSPPGNKESEGRGIHFRHAYEDLMHHHLRRAGEWEVAYGDPAAAICSRVAATEGAMIAMVSHSHWGVRRKLIGSVSQQVVAKSEVPVIVVPRGWSSSGTSTGESE